MKENILYDTVEVVPARQSKLTTNGDRIRSMSDEELQAWFCRNRDCWDCPFRCWDRCTFADWIKQPAASVVKIHVDISDAKL